jgi:(S)-citramalyl-CoA lyase
VRADFSFCRCLLFTPALRPAWFEKARASGADGLIVDLEDSIGPSRKAEARAIAVRYFAESVVEDQFTRCLRINSLRTADGLRDITAILEANIRPEMLIIPKVESAEEVCILHELLSGEFSSIVFVALVETAVGLSAADQIANAHGRLGGLIFGGVDLAADIGATMDWDALLFARSRVVQAAATARLGVMDVPYLDLEDANGLKHETQSTRKLGFTGKAAIHPNQVAIINSIFTPDPAALEEAKQILSAADACGGDVCEVNGKMIDGPVVRAARRVLAIGGRLTNRNSK